MDKEQIEQELVIHHDNFIAMLRSLSDEDFLKEPLEKWTAGQQLDHIMKSVKPVDMAFGLPMFVLKMKFGLANRPSKTYEGLVAKYQKALKDNTGFKMPSEFAPSKIPSAKKERALEKMDNLIRKMCGRLAKFSEAELDTYILPHPLMGKLTLREMLYFTIYHVQHHHRQIPKNLAHANPSS